MSRRRSKILAWVALAALASPVTTWAATTTGTLNVSANVISACTVTGATLNFGGSIDALSAAVPLDTTATMGVTCTATTAYSIALSAGANAGGVTNFASRSVKNGSNTLSYQLYTDSGRSTVWGDGTASTGMHSGTGTGSNQNVPIYGRMPSLTGAVPGTYTDTVTITVSY